MSSQRTSDNHDVRVLILLLACSGVIVMGCLVLNGFTWARLQKSASQQEIALDRLAQYSTVFSTLQDVELGQRGFAISGDEFYLQIFNEAREQYALEWERLVELEKKDGRAPGDIGKLRGVSDELIRDAMEIVIVRQREGKEAAEAEFVAGRRNSVMRDVRALYAAEMESLEETIRKRNLRAEDDFQAGLATSMAMGVLALGIGGIALFLLRRVLKEIRRSERYAVSMLKSEESRRQKDVFLAMMSHEIRTPLNAIIGFGQLAEQEDMGAKGRRYVKSILDGANSLLLLINDILDLSKLQAGRMELKLEPTRMKEMLRFLERLFQQGCAKKGIRFRLEMQEGLPDVLIVDSTRLRQIMMNLVGNAVKFTESGEVSVVVSGEQEIENKSLWTLRINVSDTGPGISKEDLSHIFEPFYQGQESTVGKSPGTGLGLSIVQRFLKLMDGELAVESELGKGTTFVIRLDHLKESARVEEESPLLDENVDFNELKAAKILAVDDNATNRELIREIFANSHHELVMAADGEEALTKVVEEKPDLVLMDLRMPGKDGPTAAREIKTDDEFRLTPIIAVTAGSLEGKDGNSPDIRKSFDGALRKPFTRREMFDALAMFLETAKGKTRRDAETEGTEESSTEEVVSAELLRKLKEVLIEEWPDVKAGMTVSEIVSFADDLEALDPGRACGRLAAYVERLREATENFKFGEMEAVLGRFPDLVAELEETKN